MDDERVTKIEWAMLQGKRPRTAGCNARLGEHGEIVRIPVVRVTLGDGSQGFGPSTANVEEASAALGQPLNRLFNRAQGSTERGLPLDFALWDLVGKRMQQPVYALAAGMTGGAIPIDKVAGGLRVPCYDTSLYIDDLHIDDDDAAAELIADEAREGMASGHRAFKIKIGRGAMHMPLEAGMRRDISVIHAVREAVGDEAPLLVDANNGYNLNLTKQLLKETSTCKIHWIEEPFHEDNVLYVDLKSWMADTGLDVLIADGEGDASPKLEDWAAEGLVDVVQYDIISYGFTAWLHLGRRLSDLDVQAAPHHYGRYYGNYASCHLAATLPNLAFVEWDEASVPALSAPGYAIEEGEVVVPETPGFGLNLDELLFEAAVLQNGWSISWTY